MKYLIVIETTKTGFSAYSPDLPGCVATGKTLKQTEKYMKEAMLMHVEGLKEEGYETPRPQSHVTYCKIAA